MTTHHITLPLLCAALCVSSASGETVVDPASFGFSPSASGAVNAAALQKALDGGSRTVRVSVPGTYDMDRTVYVDSHTRLEFVKGAALRKTARYCSVVINRGAHCYGHDTDIEIKGLEIIVNGFELKFYGPEEPERFIRGQLALYDVDHVRVSGFRCMDYGSDQYCVHIVKFRDVVFEDFEINGRKDGVHFNSGSGFVVRNGVISAGDDAVAINAGDWPDCAPVIGTIENGLVERLKILPRPREQWSRQVGEFGLVIASVWPDWHVGIKLQRNDMVRHGRNVYAVSPMPFSTNEYVSVTPPVHTNGIWKSPEGISFLFMKDDGTNRADAKNIVFRDIEVMNPNGLSIWWETGHAWSRAVHPEIKPEDYPVIDITLERCHTKFPGGPLIRRGVPANIKLVDCTSMGPLLWLGRPLQTGGRSYPGCKRRIVVENCLFDGGPRYDFRFFGACENLLTINDCRGTRVPAVHAVAPATVKLSGNSACRLVQSAEESADYDRIVDAWLQLPIAKGGAGFYDF